MSHLLELNDEQYETLLRAAQARGQAPDALLAAWLEEIRDRDRDPRYYETDDWLRHLGVSEERIHRANAKVAAEGAEDVGEAIRDADTR